MSLGLDHAFEHEPGVGGHADAVFRGADDLQRLAEEAAGDVALVLAEGETGRGRDHEQGMAADHHGNRQRPAPLPRHGEQPPPMAARMQ